MQRKKQDHIEWLEFDLLSEIPNLHHAVFLRKGPFDGYNYEVLEPHLKKYHKSDRLVRGVGCHQDQIALVHPASLSEIDKHDGLMSSTPGQTLMMKHADCQIGLFYDPIHHVIANVHSGWRGSVKNIFGKTVEEMGKQFGTRPSDVLVCISPSLGPENAEFINYAIELPEEFWPFQFNPLYFDFWSITDWQLRNAGVLPHHIEIARLCTYSNPNDYYSYRRDKTIARQNGTCITLT